MLLCGAVCKAQMLHNMAPPAEGGAQARLTGLPVCKGCQELLPSLAPPGSEDAAQHLPLPKPDGIQPLGHGVFCTAPANRRPPFHVASPMLRGRCCHSQRQEQHTCKLHIGQCDLPCLNALLIALECSMKVGCKAGPVIK